VLGVIDLDPASCAEAQKIVRATNFYTIEDDGLRQRWFGRVWLNPPYHRKLGPLFVAKLIEEFEAGRVSSAIMLTNNGTDTRWFYDAARIAGAVCFTQGRVGFYKPDGEVVNPTQGQSFLYFGKDVQRFGDVFKDIGLVFEPRK
jgi:ParB family chromosome partitioning protein